MNIVPIQKLYIPFILCLLIEGDLYKICKKARNIPESESLKNKISNMIILYTGLIDLQVNRPLSDDDRKILPYTLFIYDYIKNDLDKVLNKAKSFFPSKEQKDHEDLKKNIVELILRLSVLIKQYI